MMAKCDRKLCQSLTGAAPNRLYPWTGTIRDHPSIGTKANVRNEDGDSGIEARWITFLERIGVQSNGEVPEM
jgi:phospholipase C